MNNVINPPAIIETIESDNLASTIMSLQSVIERSAIQLTQIKNEIKQNRESLKSIFENDPEFSEATEIVKDANSKIKVCKSKLQADPTATRLKVQISELKESKKEIEEALSGHLVNYHQLTNSNSFDTSDGDQWEFSIKAKVKPRQLKLFDK